MNTPHLAIAFLSLFLTLSPLSAAQQGAPYLFATITNHTGSRIKLLYFRPDPGFYGMHVIVHDCQELASGQSARIMITRNNITAPRCTYQYPNAQGNYQLIPTDSIEIPIDPTQNNQRIQLGFVEAK